ncbi:IDLSRF-like peptide isoform X3 [Procambarus clarkii]|uniref:IDLSRF-like peptide isoform X3 n=1 Tax=Procambarus clarkii TaxID=6728 RepID=UPI001E67410A|nr:IDLSRF-like peptide isoform X2 [Procambarus clarkii]
MARPSSSLSQGLALLMVLLAASTSAIDISRLPGHRHYTKRSAYGGYGYRQHDYSADTKAERECMAYEPFRCPGGTMCISIQYLCDGAPDCPDGYDENPRLCTAAKRPPVEETASFLQSLLASHGPNYLEKLFGTKARNALKPLGGVEKVAIALSESQTIDDFGDTLHLLRSDVEHLRSVFMAVENGDIGMLKSLGIKDSELGDVKFFLEKLVNTGFLD